MNIFVYLFMAVVGIAVIAMIVRRSKPRGTAKGARKLREAFLLKEECGRYLGSLEELGQDEPVNQELAKSMRERYQRGIAQATEDVTRVKSNLTRELEVMQRSLAPYEVELKRLSLRAKVGELPLKEYKSFERKLRESMKQDQSVIREIERLLAVECSDEVKRHRDVAIQRTAVPEIPARNVEEPVPQPEARPESAGARCFPSFGNSVGETATPRARLLGLIGGPVLIFSIFLTWVSTRASYSISLAFSGSDLSTTIVAAAIVCGIIAVAAAFLAQSRPRAIVHTSAGSVALIALLLAWLSGPPILVEAGEMGQSLHEEVLEMLALREGFWLYVIAASALLIGGAVQVKSKPRTAGKEGE